MFPLPISLYVKIGIAVLLVCGIFYAGWHTRNKDFLAYKEKVEQAAKTQELHIAEVKKQQELATKGIENEYNAKLALLRQYYANGVRQPNSSKLPTNGNTPLNIDDFTPNGLLIKCAETTQQLVSLQSWINEQLAIK